MTSSTESPRLVCRIVRWRAALTERSAPSVPIEPSSGHRANCPACREYFRSIATLETRLRHEGRAISQTAPAGLEQRIAAAVRHARIPERAPERRTFPLWSAGLVAAAAAVALVLVLNHGPKPPRATPDPAPAEIAAVVTALQSLPQHFSERLAPSAARLATADPLGRELANVKADARSALQFLAENFLPTEREPTSSVRDSQPAVQGG